MDKRLIVDYLTENGFNTYPEFKVDDVQEAGGVVFFKECEMGSFPEFIQHNVQVWHVIAWMYSQGK